MSARRWRRFGVGWGVAAILSGWLVAARVVPAASSSGSEPEVIVTGVPRPLQLAIAGTTLIILSPGSRGAAAGEVYRVDLTGELPVDLSRQPRLRIPFQGSRETALGSLAVRPTTGEVFLGEENGRRILRLDREGRLVVYATGLQYLGGGGTLAVDGRDRLVLLDYADPNLSSAAEPTPRELEQFRQEDYRGPLVLRLDLDPSIPLPRRLASQPPFFPPGWGGRGGGALLPRLISVVPIESGDLVLLSSAGELFRLGDDRRLVRYATLPPGQYNRTTIAAGTDGSVFVGAGFHLASVFRVSPDGTVTVLAANLGDPEGVALDGRGHLYVAESSFHRVLRFNVRG